MLASGFALGILAGVAWRRSLKPLTALSIRFLPLLIVSLAARALASVPSPIGFDLYVSAFLGTLMVAVANLRLPGAALIATGGALNLAVVLANSGMPVDPGALLAAHASMPTDALHVVVTSQTVGRPIADVIAVSVFRSVYSLGDIFIAFGGFIIPFAAYVRRQPQ